MIVKLVGYFCFYDFTLLSQFSNTNLDYTTIRTDLRPSARATAATQLVLLNRFTGAIHSHYLQKLCIPINRDQFCSQEKMKEIWLSPMTNPLYQQKIRKPKDNTQTSPKTSITQRLRTDLGRSVGVTSRPTGVVKPVYGYSTFQLTAKAV